jgi:PST family polysaccharide transporter
VVLARLLSPDDFGLLGMVVVFTGFLALFQNLGLGPAIVQDRSLDRHQLSGLFWINFLFSVLLAGIAVAVAPLVAEFYGEPVVVPIMAALALAFPLSAVGVVPGALLTRHMRFRPLSTIDIAAQAVGLALGVGLAVAGYGVWALVWQQVAAAAATAAGKWAAAGWRPGFTVPLRALRGPLGFGAWLQAGSVLNWATRNTDDLLVGRVIGASSLGIYQMAYRLMLWPIQNVARVVGQVMFPALSAIQDDTARVARAFLRGVGVVALVTFPVMVGAFVVADTAIPLVLGSQWTPVVPVFEILCGLGLIQSVATNTGWIFLSQGRADVRLKLQLFMAPLLILSFVVGLPWGIVGVAGAYAVTSGLLIPIQLHVAGRLVGLRLPDIAGALAGVLACAMAMGAVVAGMGWIAGGTLPTWAVLFAQVAVGIAVYTLLVHRARLPAYLELRQVLAERAWSQPRKEA